LTAAALCVSLGAVAQQPAPPPGSDPGALQRHAADSLDVLQQQKQLEEFKSEAGIPLVSGGAAASATPAGGARFLLKCVVTNPSQVLPASALAAITARYEGHEASFTELSRMIGEINQLYVAKGYVTARALLPAQTIENGVVRLLLVESRLDKVTITGRSHTRESFLRRSVPFNPGDIVRLQPLQHSLTELNLAGDLKVRAELQPGHDFGTTTIALRVQEPELLRSTVFADNLGREGVGRYRFGVLQSYSGLLGLADPVNIGFYWTGSTVDGSISYSYPLPWLGLRVGPSFDVNHIALNSPSLRKFAITGRSEDASVRLGLPLWTTPRLQTLFSLTPHWKHSTVASKGVPLSETTVRSIDLSGELRLAEHRGVWAVHSITSGGFHNFGGDAPFVKEYASVTRNQDLTHGLLGTVRVTGQMNFLSSLPSLEQVQIGGMSTVRGYPEGRQIGDRGYAATAELQYPPPFPHTPFWGKPLGECIRGVVFFDHGAVYDSFRSAARPAGDDRYLTSTGLGLLIKLPRSVAARLDFGAPLRAKAGIPDVGFHYYVQATPPLAEIVRKAGEIGWKHLREHD